MKQHANVAQIQPVSLASTKKIIPYEAIKDYKDLFLGKRSGHLTKYIYCSDTDYYERLVQEETGYYLTRTETEILVKNSHEIAKILGENCNIVEIGPGPEYILRTKVLPLLKSLQNLASYTALDTNLEYAIKASEFIEDHMRNVDSFSYKVDCATQLQRYCDGKTCLLFLGGTLGNFTNIEINKIFSSFANFLEKGEYCIFTVDCNKDLLSIKNAYDNSYVKQLALSIMRYFKDIFHVNDFDPEQFKYSYEWSAKSCAVYVNLVAKEEQSFYFLNERIMISKNQKYHVAVSRKFRREFVDGILQKNHLKLVRKFTDDNNTMITYLIQKY
ncbi:MAG: L-histidine N(alpha)-methyltransferase [Rickettsiales bacterium]|nr:L-histidine N(alpha)-methyltransferase [Rickettsiales bacterium]